MEKAGEKSDEETNGNRPHKGHCSEAVGILSFDFGTLPARQGSLSWALSAFPGFRVPQQKGAVLMILSSCALPGGSSTRWREC